MTKFVTQLSNISPILIEAVTEENSVAAFSFNNNMLQGFNFVPEMALALQNIEIKGVFLKKVQKREKSISGTKPPYFYCA